MRKGMTYREPVRVLFHLNGGFTKVGCENIRVEADIPTRLIPLHLRALGSRFLLVWETMLPETPAEIEEWRKKELFKVEELPS